MKSKNNNTTTVYNLPFWSNFSWIVDTRKHRSPCWSRLLENQSKPTSLPPSPPDSYHSLCTQLFLSRSRKEHLFWADFRPKWLTYHNFRVAEVPGVRDEHLIFGIDRWLLNDMHVRSGKKSLCPFWERICLAEQSLADQFPRFHFPGDGVFR